MSEELGQEGQTDEVVAEPKQPSGVEQKALDMGWRPREEFDGDEEDFIDAKEFIQRQPLFDKITAQSKELKNLKRSLEDFKGHYTKVQETAYQKALKELKTEKRQALVDGDIDKFTALEEAQEQVESEKTAFIEKQTAVVQEDSYNPEFQSWINKNSWYSTQPHMQAFADDVGAQFKYQVQVGKMTPADVLKEVEKQVREEFPNRFRNPNKDKPSSVEGSSGKSGKSPEFELSDMERRIMNNLVNTKGPDGKPLVTKEKYIADLKAVKGIK